MACLGSCLGQWFQWGVKNRRNFIWLNSNTNPPACWGTKDAPFINSAYSDIVMPYFHALDLISLFYSLDLALYFPALRPSCRRCLHHLVWSESVIITLKRSVESSTFSLPFLVTVNTIKSWQRMTSLHWSLSEEWLEISIGGWSTWANTDKCTGLLWLYGGHSIYFSCRHRCPYTFTQFPFISQHLCSALFTPTLLHLLFCFKILLIAVHLNHFTEAGEVLRCVNYTLYISVHRGSVNKETW